MFKPISATVLATALITVPVSASAASGKPDSPARLATERIAPAETAVTGGTDFAFSRALARRCPGFSGAGHLPSAVGRAVGNAAASSAVPRRDPGPPGHLADRQRRRLLPASSSVTEKARHDDDLI
jgi:hypothetical protein